MGRPGPHEGGTPLGSPQPARGRARVPVPPQFPPGQSVPSPSESPLPSESPAPSESPRYPSPEGGGTYRGSAAIPSQPAPPQPAPQPAPPQPAPPARRRRTGLWVSLVAVLALVAGIGALAVWRPGPVAELLGDPAPTASPTVSPPPPEPVLGAAGDAPRPTAEGIAAAIDGLAADSRVGQLSASIVDMATGEQLYERDGDQPRVPASVNKLVTGVAVLSVRGPSHTLTTRAVAGAEPGEVVLVGGGDPTLSVAGKGAYRGAARLDKLADAVKAQLGTTKPTKVLVDGSVFTGPTSGPGWDSDIANSGYAGHVTGLMVDGGRIDPKQRRPRSTRPELAAGKAFAKLLGVPEESVAAGTAPQDAKQLGAVESLPMIRLVEIMIGDSDNVVAEALARQVAIAEGEEPSFSGAATATASVLTKLGLPADQVTLADGSGLSRGNKLSASLLTSLLVLAGGDEHPELSGLFTGLAVAGYSGTLHDRFGTSADAAVGLVRAKTGTLNGVNALAGVVVDADGRLLGFSLIANGVPGGLEAAEPVLDQIAAKLAACGCR